MSQPFPQQTWDMVVGYIGMEKRLGRIRKRDWRFEQTRADLNRIRYLLRAAFYAYNTKEIMNDIRNIFEGLRRKRIKQNPLLHRIAMAELLQRWGKGDTKLDRSYRQFYKTYASVREVVTGDVIGGAPRPLPILLALSALRLP